jgi:uncharacterized phage-associated protein
MTTVFDVAKYILDRCGAMSAMKLQKLVFYSQAMSLVWDDQPLFDDDFQAWAKGSVCKSLFDAHKGMYMLTNSDFLADKLPDISNLSKDNLDTINAVVDGLKDYAPFQLSEMTHHEEPWIHARQGCANGCHCENVIPKESMSEYYAGNW